MLISHLNISFFEQSFYFEWLFYQKYENSIILRTIQILKNLSKFYCILWLFVATINWKHFFGRRINDKNRRERFSLKLNRTPQTTLVHWKKLNIEKTSFWGLLNYKQAFIYSKLLSWSYVLAFRKVHPPICRIKAHETVPCKI